MYVKKYLEYIADHLSAGDYEDLMGFCNFLKIKPFDQNGMAKSDDELIGEVWEAINERKELNE